MGKTEEELPAVGCIVATVCVIIAVPLLIGGYSCGKYFAEQDFYSTDQTYSQFEETSSAMSQRIDDAKRSVQRQIEDARNVVCVAREKRERIELGVKELETSVAAITPFQGKQVYDSPISEADKDKIANEFCLWAEQYRGEEYGIALEAHRKQEFFQAAAEERLKEIEEDVPSWKKKLRGIGRKVGIFNPEDKPYQDFLSKYRAEKEKYDNAICKLQDEFFGIETRNAMDEIMRRMNGTSGNDGIRVILVRASGNASSLRKDVEKRLGDL